MATDGVKIIDGDLAHDVYHTFMDLYDAGESTETIKATVEQLRVDNDDVDDEIFITAYALALWEIGQLNEKTLSQVAFAIQQDAFANYLTQSEDAPSEGRKRQAVLKRFWNKITQPNLRPRKRKSHKFKPNSFLMRATSSLFKCLMARTAQLFCFWFHSIAAVATTCLVCPLTSAHQKRHLMT
jgi:hypothetical protein